MVLQADTFTLLPVLSEGKTIIRKEGGKTLFVPDYSKNNVIHMAEVY